MIHNPSRSIRPAALLAIIAAPLIFACVASAQHPTGDPSSLAALEAEVTSPRLPKITGILLSRNGSLIYEKYFGEGSRTKLNDTRSVTKTLTALVVGRAIRDGAIPGIDTKIMPYFGDLKPIANDDPSKEDIRLKDLLSMGSALSADDSDGDSPGNEDRLHEQRSWSRWAVDLPVRMDTARDGSGYESFHYATVNAFLVGQVLQAATRQPVDGYIAETLLKPLGIEHFAFERSPIGEVMTGGGLELRGVDLWKIGQLVLDRGSYEGRLIIPASWVDACLTLRHTDTEGPGVGYGFYFWHMDFPVGDKSESGWFMAGNGGNIVVIFPRLKAVAVVTRTDFNGRNTAGQTIGLLSKFILPVLEGTPETIPQRRMASSKADFATP
jgi:CubicO group peptidase (beta-lactamase class C family)